MIFESDSEEPAFAKASAGRLDLSAVARRAKAEGRGRPLRPRPWFEMRAARAPHHEAEQVSLRPPPAAKQRRQSARSGLFVYAVDHWTAPGPFVQPASGHAVLG